MNYLLASSVHIVRWVLRSMWLTGTTEPPFVGSFTSAERCLRIIAPYWFAAFAMKNQFGKAWPGRVQLLQNSYKPILERSGHLPRTASGCDQGSNELFDLRRPTNQKIQKNVRFRCQCQCCNEFSTNFRSPANPVRLQAQSLQLDLLYFGALRGKWKRGRATIFVYSWPTILGIQTVRKQGTQPDRGWYKMTFAKQSRRLYWNRSHT